MSDQKYATANTVKTGGGQLGRVCRYRLPVPYPYRTARGTASDT